MDKIYVARSLLSNGFFYVYADTDASGKRLAMYSSWYNSKENKIDEIDSDVKSPKEKTKSLASFFSSCLAEYLLFLRKNSLKRDSAKRSIEVEVLSICNRIRVQSTKSLRSSSKNDYLVTWESDKSDEYFFPIIIDDSGNQSELIVVDSVQKYLKEIHNYSTNRKIYFRGQKLGQVNLPSLFREKEYVDDERKMIEDIYSALPFEMSKYEYEIEKLITLKHYNLPSRLYDITSNPLVGLYFACDDGVDKKANTNNGIVLTCFPNDKIKEKGLFSDTVTTLATLSYIEVSSTSSDQDFISEFDFQAKRLDNRFYSDIVESMSEFDKVVLFNPVLANQRIINQQGAFLLPGRNNSFIYEPPLDFFSAFVEKEDDRTTRKVFIIPYDKKKDILKELDQLGISTDMMYPDLEHTIAYRKKQTDNLIESNKKESEKN